MRTARVGPSSELTNHLPRKELVFWTPNEVFFAAGIPLPDAPQLCPV